MEFSASLRVFGFSKLSEGCSSHDLGNIVEGKDTWEIIAMAEVTFALFDVLSFEYELKGVWGWWDKEECGLHKVPDEGTGYAY